MSQTGHEQTAIENASGGWHVECECGAKTSSYPTNFEAWCEPLGHRPNPDIVSDAED